MTRSVHVLPHTHWDREWYDPFPVFRVRLVRLLDDLLPRLDEPAGLAHFQLDGQMAAVDDYLEVRPQEAERITRLNAEGRLSMGPWYVLPDEFLVSGETLVRNLQWGIRRAEQLGGSSRVGYLPDMFGHIAAMPALLRGFGMEHAVVWRGVPASLGDPAFRWRSPDGSEVRAEYLPGGYFNGSDMPDDPAALADRISLFTGMQRGLVGDTVLWMAGMDHQVPPPHLARVVEALDAEDGWSISIGSLEQYLAGTGDPSSLPVIEGELRSGARANLLMGVTSNRVDVKVAAARAERALERIAEPLVALWSADAQRWSALLEVAWRGLILNAAHDSICACSHDEVVDAVLHRYAESGRTAQTVAFHVLCDAAPRFAEPGTYLVNPTAAPRSDVVQVEVPADAPADDRVQVLAEHPAEEELYRAGAAEAPVLLGRDLILEHPGTAAVRLERSPGTLHAHLLPTDEPGALSPLDALGEVGTECGRDPGLTLVTVLHRAEPTRRVLTMSPTVPGFGWARCEPTAPTQRVEPVGELGLGNGTVTVEVDPDDGTWSIDGVAGYGRIVDGGDAGDTYNWCPPGHDVIVDRPGSVQVERLESGPLRGRIEIRSRYRLPRELTPHPDGGEARTGELDQELRTVIELRAGDGTVRVTTELDHQARDHRLRVHLPLPERAARSHAECAYGIVERPLWAEGGPNEWGLPTFPSRRFVSAGGMTVTHEGLCEYELVDLDGEPDAPGTTAGALALTLVRATGWLSRGPMASRPLPAGPEDRLDGAQVRASLSLRYAICVDPTVDPYLLADRTWTRLREIRAEGGGDLPVTGSHLRVEGAEVDAVLREGASLVVRVHEPRGVRGELVVHGRTGTVVDLTGRELAPFDGRMGLAPHQIVTVRLDP